VNGTALRTTLAATALMGLAMGSRSAFGLFLSPLNSATGIGLATISLAVAIGQLSLGVGQPLVAALAERHGAARVMAAGAALAAIGTAWLASVHDAWGLIALMILTSLALSAVGSNAMLIGEVGRRVPATLQGMAAGWVGAGGSAGQLVFGPATQMAIAGLGWRAALWATAGLTLFALPLAMMFRRTAPAPTAAVRASASSSVRDALGDRRFWLISGSFTMCGFHVAFLSTHMPGVIERCGLPLSLAGTWLAVAGGANIVGSIAIGMLMRRFDDAPLLAAIYAARAAAIALLLALPPTAPVMLAFALIMGLTYIAPLAPTAHLVATHFGVQRLGTLFGIVMIAHQAGSFAGVWLGGVAVEHSGSFTPLWIADLSLALVGALLQWPLRAAATGNRAAPPAAAPCRSACAARPAARGA
jgi:predicted MFS family arabinose efflux permease